MVDIKLPKINKPLYIFKIFLVNFITPTVVVLWIQLHTALFNPTVEYSLVERLTKLVWDAEVFGLLAMGGIIIFFVIMRQVKPLFDYFEKGINYEKARRVSIKIPWILLIFHGGLWIISTVIYSMAYNWNTTEGLHISGLLPLNLGNGLMGGIFAALLTINILKEAKRHLDMTSIDTNEKDSFSHYKSHIVGIIILIFAVVNTMYFVFSYFKFDSRLAQQMAFTPAVLWMTFSIFIISITAVLVQRWGNRFQLNFMREKLKELIKGEGDLSKRVVLLEFDEIGRIAADVNEFIDYLAEFIATVKSVSESTASSSSQLETAVANYESFFNEFSTFMEEIIKGVHSEQSELVDARKNIVEILDMLNSYVDNIIEQTGAIEETSKAVEQMLVSISSTIELTSSTISNTDDLSQKTHISSEELSRVDTNIQSVNVLSTNVLDITKSISDIAETTNVLALNASIEASHASVAGKGFVVVAGEIKKLAYETGQSTSGIVSHIKIMNDKIKSGNNMIGSLKNSMESMFLLINSIIQQIEDVSVRLSDNKIEADGIISLVAVLLTSAEEMTKLSTKQKARSYNIRQIMDGLQLVSDSTFKLVNDVEYKLADMRANNTEIHEISSVNIANASKLRSITQKFTI